MVSVPRGSTPHMSQSPIAEPDPRTPSLWLPWGFPTIPPQPEPQPRAWKPRESQALCWRANSRPDAGSQGVRGGGGGSPCRRMPSPPSDPLRLPEGDAHPEAALGTLPRAQPEIPHFRPLPQPVHSQGEGSSRVFSAQSSGPNSPQGPPGSEPDPWPPLQREKRWSVSSGGTAERSVSGVSPPSAGWVRVRWDLRGCFPPSPPPLPGPPQPTSPRAYPWHK